MVISDVGGGDSSERAWVLDINRQNYSTQLQNGSSTEQPILTYYSVEYTSTRDSTPLDT